MIVDTAGWAGCTRWPVSCRSCASGIHKSGGYPEI